MALKPGDMETNYEVRSLDASISLEEYRALPKHPVYIILDNLRSAFNVGSIFRLCDTMRVSGLFLCGYTAFPPHKKLEKTSLGTIDYVPWRHFDKASDAVNFLLERGVKVWAAETTSQSKPYDGVIYPEQVGVVFGNEALGVSRDVLDLCETFIEIPTYGFKNSLNVATSVSVVGYEVISQMEKKKSPAF